MNRIINGTPNGNLKKKYKIWLFKVLRFFKRKNAGLFRQVFQPRALSVDCCLVLCAGWNTAFVVTGLWSSRLG